MPLLFVHKATSKEADSVSQNPPVAVEIEDSYKDSQISER